MVEFSLIQNAILFFVISLILGIALTIIFLKSEKLKQTERKK